MIEDLRFVKKDVKTPVRWDDKGKVTVVRTESRNILEAYDGHQWFEVPLVEIEENQDDR